MGGQQKTAITAMNCRPVGPSQTFDEADMVIMNLPRRINHQIIISGGEENGAGLCR